MIMNSVSHHDYDTLNLTFKIMYVKNNACRVDGDGAMQLYHARNKIIISVRFHHSWLNLVDIFVFLRPFPDNYGNYMSHPDIPQNIALKLVNG
jgi:hypothetical protein